MKFLSKIIKRFYRRFNFYQTTFDDTYNKSENIKILNEELLDQIKKQYPQEFTERKYKILKDRISDENEDVYVLSNGEEITSYGCMAINKFYEGTSGYKGNLESDTVYLFDLVTFDKFKNQGYMKLLVESIFAVYKEKGYKFATTIVSFDNFPSNRLMKGFSFKPIGIISTKYFRSRKFISYKDL